MSAATLPGPLFCGYMAGQCRVRAHNFLREARHYRASGFAVAARESVKFARAYNHEFLSYLRQAREQP